MPTYQYVCPTCNTPCEITKPISQSSDPEKCGVDDCDGVLVRDFNGQASTFKLNGSGWTGKLNPRRKK